MYLVSDKEELQALREHLGFGPSGASGWFDCCGEDAGIYGEASGSSIAELTTHEYTHFLLYEHYGRGRPRWIEEGVATYYETEHGPASTLAEVYWTMANVQYLAQNDMLDSLPRLELTFGSDRAVVLSRYRHSHAVIRHVVEVYGYDALDDLLRQVSRSSDTERALIVTFGKDYAKFEADFRRWLLAWERTTRGSKHMSPERADRSSASRPSADADFHQGGVGRLQGAGDVHQPQHPYRL